MNIFGLFKKKPKEEVEYPDDWVEVVGPYKVRYECHCGYMDYSGETHFFQPLSKSPERLEVCPKCGCRGWWVGGAFVARLIYEISDSRPSGICHRNVRLEFKGECNAKG